MASFTTEPRTPSLRTLLREVWEGRLVVPRFQRRGLLWDATRRLELFDSIYRGFPIGSLLVWKTETQRMPPRELVGLVPTGGGEGSGSTPDYLLDGHQRVSVLYTALAPAFFQEPPALRLVEDATDFRWPVCFDLRATPGANPFVQAPRGERPPHVIPLDRLFDAYLLDDARDALRKAGGTREESNRVVELSELFRNTQVPVVPVVTESVADVATSFKRVNSGGVRMDEVDMVHALSWTSSFDLDERLEDARQRLAEVEWGDLPRSDLLGVVKLRLGLTLYKTSPEDLARQIKERPEIVSEAVEALMAVARLLVPWGIHGPRALPYTAQAVLLASGKVPLLDTSRIYAWIVRTGLAERFAGATDTTFRGELDSLARVLVGQEVWPVIEVDAVERFDFRTARCRLLSVLLAKGAGDPPRIAADGAEALAFLLPARRSDPLTSTVANRFVLPAVELGSLRQALREGVNPLGEGHFVDDTFAELYANGAFDAALRHRLDAIDAEERAWAAQVNVTVRRRDA
jgi:hypothetical protein